MPRRSSTRASTTVVSPSCAAAGLKTTLTGYGQSAAVRIGFAGWRVNSSRAAHAGTDSRAPLAIDGRQAGDIEQQRRAVEGERRLRPLVVVRRLVPEAVAAASGGEVVQRALQLVAAEEPIERVLRPDPVLRVRCDGERGQLGLDERRGVERLLVPRTRRGLGAVAPTVAGQPEHTVREAGLVAEPAERVEPRLRHRVLAQRDTTDDERVRQAGVVVGESVLEPEPVLGRVLRVRRRQLLEHTVQNASGHRVEPVRVEACEPEGSVGAGPQRSCRRDRAHDRVEQPLARADDGRDPGGGEDLAEGPDRAADVVAVVRARRASGGRSP